MKKLALLSVFLALPLLAFAQTVPVPQYSYGLSFLGSGVYNQTTAVDNIVGYQFTANNRLEADLVTAPGGGVSDYEGGNTYNLCGIKAIENLLATTTLNCGKIDIPMGGTIGLGRVQQGSSSTVDSVAFMVKAGLSIPSASGAWSVGAVVGYGQFGASIPGQSNKGIFFNIPLTWGGGNSAMATAAKSARKVRSETKKRAKLDALAAKKS